MDRGAWRATVYGVAESDMTYLASKQQQHSLSYSQKMSYTSIIASHQI